MHPRLAADFFLFPFFYRPQKRSSHRRPKMAVSKQMVPRVRLSASKSPVPSSFSSYIAVDGWPREPFSRVSITPSITQHDWFDGCATIGRNIPCESGNERASLDFPFQIVESYECECFGRLQQCLLALLIVTFEQYKMCFLLISAAAFSPRIRSIGERFCPLSNIHIPRSCQLTAIAHNHCRDLLEDSMTPVCTTPRS